MKRILLAILCLIIAKVNLAQSSAVVTKTALWTKSDRTYLADNLSRSLNELATETGKLTLEQWNFKESSDRWSIAQIVEHIGIWELLMQREISQALAQGPKPELNNQAKPDSLVLMFIMEQKKHYTNEYTQPFTFAQPLGEMGGEVALKWVTKLRKESIDFVNTTDKDLRLYSQMNSRGTVHQVYITTFGHMDRHLRQIRKVKQHPNFPK